MRGPGIALIALMAVAPCAALTAPIDASPRPVARTTVRPEAMVPAALVLPTLVLPTAPPPDLAPRAPLSAGDTPLRPRPRPGARSVAVLGGLVNAAMSVRPHARPPAAQRPAEIVQVAAPASYLAVAIAVRPPVRPENLRRLSQAKAVAYVTQPMTEAITGRKGSVCGDPAIRGTTIPPIAARIKGCGLADGVRITSVAGVKLSTPADIDCTTAKALKAWVTGGAIPAVGKRGGGLSTLQVAASYACRGRNNQKGAKISEHGKGHAIDISGLVLANGTSVSVLKGWGSDAHGKALASMRKSACGPFTTVLGPGSDRFHSDHLHFDTARGRGPYCH
jgi:hypothetical protein